MMIIMTTGWTLVINRRWEGRDQNNLLLLLLLVVVLFALTARANYASDVDSVPSGSFPNVHILGDTNDRDAAQDALSTDVPKDAPASSASSFCSQSPDAGFPGGLLVNCSGRGLWSIPEHLPWNTTTLLLFSNALKRVPNDAFVQLGDLRILDLSVNKITVLESGAFRGLGKLLKLNLRQNKLTFRQRTYPRDVFKPLVSLTKLILSHNNFHLKTRRRSELDRGVSTGGERAKPSARVLKFQKETTEKGFDSVSSRPGPQKAITPRQRSLKTNRQSASRAHQSPDVDDKESAHNSGDEVAYPDVALSQLVSLKHLSMDGLTNTSLGPGFRNLTKLTHLSLGGFCWLVTLERATLENVPTVIHLSLKDCGISNLTSDVFASLPNLADLDLSYNQALGFDLLAKAFPSLATTRLASLTVDFIVPSRTFGTVLTQAHLASFSSLKHLKRIQARCNGLEGLMPGLLCSHMPPKLEYVHVDGNLWQMAPYVNDLQCLRSLKTLYVRGMVGVWTPPLRPPDAALSVNDLADHNDVVFPVADRVIDHHDVDQQFGDQDDVDNIFSIGEGIKDRDDMDDFFIDHDDVNTNTVLPEGDRATDDHDDTGNVLYVPFDDHAGQTFTDNKQFPLNEGRGPDAEDTSHTTSTECSEGKQFHLPPSMTYLKARLLGLNYNLKRVMLSPNNSLKLLDFSQNHLPVWRGPMCGFHNVRYLFLKDTQAEDVSPTFFQGFPSLQRLDISNNRLRKVFRDDVQGELMAGLTQLRVLDMSNNNVGHVHNATLYPLASLRELHVRNNGMARFSVDLSRMDHLHHLDLSYNQLLSLPEPTRLNLDRLAKSHNVTVNMQFNPIACTCDNIDFLHWIRESKVYFGTEHNYYCMQYSGHAKEMNDLKGTIAHLEVQCGSYVGIFVGSSAFCFLFLTLLLVALAYRFRWKLRYLYYASRLGLQRQHLDNQQEQREFRFDAFVSFSSEDSDFVEGVLREGLEEDHGLRLCIHTRDFTPGQYIATNIVSSVQSSRRTLVVLSRALLASDWCHYELQMALMEAAHTGRDVLIFLIYEHVPTHELSRDMLANLQATVYIEYPREESSKALFWARLAQALRE